MEPRPAATDHPVEPEAATPPTEPGGAPADTTGAPAEAPQPPAELVARRQFFLAFSRDTARAAVQVAGMAVAFQRGTGAAAGELLGLAVSPEETLSRLAGDASAVPVADIAPPRPVFRSPFRIEGDEIVLLDQRVYPDETREIRCTTAAEIAAAMRERRVVGAPVLGQVAAYGVWRGAITAQGQTTFIRLAVLHNAAESLRHARRYVASVGRATRRVTAVWEAELERTGDDAVAAGAARREADAIASETTAALARITALGAAALAQPDLRPLEILTLGTTGALAGGQAGGAVGVILEIARSGRAVHVWLLETSPGGSGARLAAWELGAAGVPTTVVADGSAAWLLARTTIDAVLVGADRVALDGATTAPIGTLAVADLAQRYGVRLWVVTPLAAVDGGVADAAGSFVESERYADVGGEEMRPDLFGSTVEARGPLQDVTPPEAIGAFVTEAGVLEPPFGPALAAGLATPADATAAPDGTGAA
jgi:methylthioribose-1-phosphate isomerase